MDDVLAFNSKLIIEIPEGPQFNIDLKAQGEGSTIVSNPSVKKIDFGSQATNQICKMEFILENKGRRTQAVTWINEKEKKNKKMNKIEEKEEFFFTLEPQTAIIAPGAKQKFVLKRMSQFPQYVVERLYCR